MMWGMGFSPYLSMLARQQQEEEERRRLEEEQRRSSIKSRLSNLFLPSTYGGEAVDPDVAKRARGQALISFGTSLLGRNAIEDPGGALGRGMAGFADTMNSTLERERQMARQKKADELERQHEAAYQANLKHDNEVQDANQRAKDRLAQAQSEAMSGLSEAQRKRLAPLVGTPDFESAYMNVTKEGEHWDNGRHMVKDPKTGEWKVDYQAPESPEEIERKRRAEAREERSTQAGERAAEAAGRAARAEERTVAKEHELAIDRRADELLQSWDKYHQNPDRGEREKTRAVYRRMANDENMIREYKAHGATREQIVQRLRQRGWDETNLRIMLMNAFEGE